IRSHKEPLHSKPFQYRPRHKRSFIYIERAKYSALLTVFQNPFVNFVASLIEGSVDAGILLFAASLSQTIEIYAKEGSMQLGRIECLLDEFIDLSDGILDARYGIFETLSDKLRQPFEESQKDLFFRFEIVENRAFREFRLFGDVFDADFREVFLDKHTVSGRDYLLTAHSLIFRGYGTCHRESIPNLDRDCNAVYAKRKLLYTRVIALANHKKRGRRSGICGQVSEDRG